MQTEIPKNETYQTGFYFLSLPPSLPPPPPLGELKGSDRGQNSSFLNMDMLHIKLKKIAHASNMLANVNPLIPPDPGVGTLGQKSTSYKQGHAAYQIKGNDKCSNMHANILSLHSENSLIL